MPTTYRIEITPSAEADISAIWEYIALDDPENATAFIVALEAQVTSLELHPERCPFIAENAILGTSYRHLLYQSYRTIFRVSGHTVVILRVIHGARLLDPES